MMQKTISRRELVIGVIATILTGGLLALPLGLVFLYVLCQRRREIEKGELDDAKNY